MRPRHDCERPIHLDGRDFDRQPIDIQRQTLWSFAGVQRGQSPDRQSQQALMRDIDVVVAAQAPHQPRQCGLRWPLLRHWRRSPRVAAGQLQSGSRCSVVVSRRSIQPMARCSTRCGAGWPASDGHAAGLPSDPRVRRWRRCCRGLHPVMFS
jgi:hypothetical protein